MSASDSYLLAARSDNPLVRAEVAADPAAPPELLYYLSEDKQEPVRLAAAENIATPIQAAGHLQRDESAQVRAALGRKVLRVLPSLGEGISRAQALKTLEVLVQDTAQEVRQAVAVTAQDTSFLPQPLALQLAEDTAQAVAVPVLRYCLSLSDEDLCSLIRRARHAWVVPAVAARKQLSNTVAQAVWESGDEQGIAALLGNTQNTLPEELLTDATEQAAIVTSYQPPLVVHPQLAPAQMERLAGFVDAALLEVLQQRAEQVRGEASDTLGVIRRRLVWREWRAKQGAGEAVQRRRAQELFGQNALDDAAVSDAIACSERAFVAQALALLATTELALAEKILDHASPKGATALCWKAGISMRTCRQLQIRLLKIPPSKALNARGGFDYPLPAADLRWQLEFYGIS